MKITTIVCDKCGREDLNEEDGFILLGSSSGKDLKYEVVGEYKEKKKPELSNELTYLGSYHDLHFCNHECLFQYFGKPSEAVEKKESKSSINNILNIDWEILPHWANWIAQDEDGKIYAYDKKPYKKFTMWVAVEGFRSHLIVKNYPNINWADTLIKRPKKVE